MKRMGAVESDSVKSARNAKDKWHKACERASETCEQTLYGLKQNRMHMASMRDSDRFLVMHCCAEDLALQCLFIIRTSDRSTSIRMC